MSAKAIAFISVFRVGRSLNITVGFQCIRAGCNDYIVIASNYESLRGDDVGALRE